VTKGFPANYSPDTDPLREVGPESVGGPSHGHLIRYAQPDATYVLVVVRACTGLGPTAMSCQILDTN
jgi:hypothetical protein